MKVEPDTKKKDPNKKKKFKGFGQLTGNANLGNFERLDNNEGGWRVSQAKIRMVRSLTFSGDVPPAPGHG